VLRVLDDLWKDHLSTMDHLRHGIHLRGYAQKNPKQEYKRESFTLFPSCWIRSSATPSACCRTFRFAAKTRPKKKPACAAKPRTGQPHAVPARRSPGPGKRAVGEEVDVALATAPVRNEQKLGRNELCYCGSGKKFKHCHGQISDLTLNCCAATALRRPPLRPLSIFTVF
jgi:preprotein translocase subunit SecA